MSRYLVVNVGYDAESQEVTCGPEEAQLYYLSEPNSVHWKIDVKPSTAEWVQITFDGDSPFTDIGMSLNPNKPGLFGTASNMKRGVFKYTIRFYDGEGNQVAQLDPRVKQDPYPPEPPD